MKKETWIPYLGTMPWKSGTYLSFLLIWADFLLYPLAWRYIYMKMVYGVEYRLEVNEWEQLAGLKVGFANKTVLVYSLTWKNAVWKRLVMPKIL